MGRKLLLSCGILSSLFYVAMNIFVPMLYEGYNVGSQTVSELSAIDAPTRPIWIVLAIIFAVLAAAFGWGVWKFAGQKRPLRIAGFMMILYVSIGLFWPPMHQREVLAAGGGTLTDTLHIAFTFVTVPLMLLIIGFGAAAFGKSFRLYSILTIIVLIGFGILTGLAAPRMEQNLATPWMGIWERISIGAYMVWQFVFAVILLRIETKSPLSISYTKEMRGEKQLFSKQDSKVKEIV
jgi:hypothetical protein